MPTICTNKPLPTFNDIYSLVYPTIGFPPGTIQYPDIPDIPPIPGVPNIPPFIVPTLPTPIYDKFSNINMEIMQFVQGLQDFQLQLTLSLMIKPLAAFLGGAIEGFLPTIPNTSINLVDLLSGNIEKIKREISEALANFGALAFPMLPSPLFHSFNIPNIEAISSMKLILKGYYKDVMMIIPNLIDRVVGILQLPGLPAIPAIPTLPDVKNMLLQKAMSLPTIPNVSGLPPLPNVPEMKDNPLLMKLKGIEIPDLFSMLSFPGFPTLSLPKPLIPTLSNFELELNESLSILFADFLTIPLKKIMDFLEGTLGLLGFSFPTICITI